MLIDDEVINGFGRTGNWWGCQTVGMTPTTISAAKQLTAAYAPLGAVMVPEDVYQAYVDHSAQIGTFGHGFTYGGHPLGCALGVKAIEIYQKRDIVGHVRKLMPLFEARAEADRRTSAGRRDALGRACRRRRDGGRQEDQAVLRPEEGRRRAIRASSSKAMARSCARSATRIAFCPPMIITEAELNELFDRFEMALADTEAWVAKEGLRAA